MNAQLQRESNFGSPRPQRRSALCALTLSLCISVIPGCASFQPQPVPRAEIDFIDINQDIRLRRMIVHGPSTKGVVLFLHGFPETLYVWKDIALTLGNDFEVHAFDWPGYGHSSRPSAERFSYSPRDYANVLKAYIAEAHIDTSKLVIYATDIGALPALMLALDDPRIATRIVVGDFAPFDRPQYMYPSLQSLKSKATADATHDAMNRTRDEILANAHRRGLPQQDQFALSPELKDDMSRGWDQGNLTSADAFFHYYSHFTRDQDYLESNLRNLKVPVTVIWGEKDIYIKPAMGSEFASKVDAKLRILPGAGHYPHLQNPNQTVEEVRALFVR